MYRNEINNEYFAWLYELVCGDMEVIQLSYTKLMTHLHNTEFVYLIPKDYNRADDGIELRRRFEMIHGRSPHFRGPCTVLEMMVALAIRCEETIMDDPRMGDRTKQWFWEMIANLGLNGMTDSRYDQDYVSDVITRFLERDYEPDGTGGLFTVRNSKYDLRDVEIWFQLCWYLDNIT